jgi:hypothetical protein
MTTSFPHSKIGFSCHALAVHLRVFRLTAGVRKKRGFRVLVSNPHHKKLLDEPKHLLYCDHPVLGLLFSLAGLATLLFVLSMTLIPILERLFIRDLIRRGEREARKIEAVRDKVEFKTEKKNHAR